MLHRCVNKFVYLSKRNDAVKFPLDLQAFHAHYRAVQKDVLTSSQLWMEADSYFKQASHLSANLCAPFARLGYSGKYLKQRTFSCAVAANQTYDFALLNFEGNVSEGPDGLVRFTVIAVHAGARFHTSKWLRCRAGESIAERLIAFLPVID